MPTQIKGQPTSAEVLGKLREEGRPVLLSFSCGKDSIAAWLAMRDAEIDVVPVYLYYVAPGVLSLIDEDLGYFEDFFKCHIHRYPHTSYYKWLNNFVCQAPENLPVIDAARMPTPTYEQLWGFIKDDLSLPKDTWVADGVRAADSIVRRASFVKHGVMKKSSHKVSPIADWLKGEVMDAIDSAGCRLPEDYELFGRSFDGLDYRFIAPIKEHRPDDYRRLLEVFPMAYLDIERHNHYGF